MPVKGVVGIEGERREEVKKQKIGIHLRRQMTSRLGLLDITNDIQVGEAEVNVEEGRDDNENEWTDDHFYGNIDVPGLPPARMKRKETSADTAERKKRVEGNGCDQSCISSMI
jgi:hypothetical protein